MFECCESYFANKRIRWGIFGTGVLILAVAVGVAVGIPLSNLSKRATTDPNLAKALQLLSEVPLVDGHNDLPYMFQHNVKNKINDVNLRENLSTIWQWENSTVTLATDIPRLKAGKVGAQFWALFVFCKTQFKDAVRACLDQADVIKRFINMYPDTFELVTTADGIMESFKKGKIGSMIGMEGGHCIDSSLATLRMFYDLGVRYMTITHSCNVPWADNWKVDIDNKPIVNGLSDFGKKVIKEMNRLGMIVDLSHVSKQTMLDTLAVTEAPVIYSHSSVFKLCNSYRNLQDDVLLKTKENGGLVMINFYSKYITCKEEATLSDVADHFDYVKNKIGADYVGMGSDYDGVDFLPEGLKDVSTFPALVAELVKRGWSDEELRKVIGLNLIRVFKKVEEFRDKKSGQPPPEDAISKAELGDTISCRTDP